MLSIKETWQRLIEQLPPPTLTSQRLPLQRAALAIVALHLPFAATQRLNRHATVVTAMAQAVRRGVGTWQC